MSWPGTCGARGQRRCSEPDIPGLETYYRDMIALLEAWTSRSGSPAIPSVPPPASWPLPDDPNKVLGLILAEPVIMDPGQGLKLWP